MKTTVEIPDSLFRRAKAEAASKGISFRVLLAEALNEKLRRPEKPWMRGFGALRHLSGETARINRVIEEEFGQVNPEDWR